MFPVLLKRRALLSFFSVGWQNLDAGLGELRAEMLMGVCTEIGYILMCSFFPLPKDTPQNLLRTTWKSQRETTLCGFILFPPAAEIRRVCLERQRKKLRLVSFVTFSLPHFSQSCLPSCLRYPNTNSPKKWHSKQILGSNPGKTSEMPDEFLWQVTYMWDFLTVPSLHKVLLLI